MCGSRLPLEAESRWRPDVALVLHLGASSRRTAGRSLTTSLPCRSTGQMTAWTWPSVPWMPCRRALRHFVLHPALDTPELRAITGDWPSRVADYRAFTSRELKAHVRRSGLQVIGYRALRALL